MRIPELSPAGLQISKRGLKVGRDRGLELAELLLAGKHKLGLPRVKHLPRDG
jgi:hypothetical protein